MTEAAHPLSLARQQYPDPFIDIASTRLPKSRKKLLELCYIFATQHPQISPIIKKLSKYPITKVIFNSGDQPDSLQDRWRELLRDKLNIHNVVESAGLDYFAFGNAFLIVHQPFIRTYTCQSCDYVHQAGELHYKFRNDKFVGRCHQCEKNVTFDPNDERTNAVDDIRIVTLKPKRMSLRENELTGHTQFFYEVPESLNKALRQEPPTRDVIDRTPLTYVKAAQQDKKIKIRSDKVLHLKEPSPSARNAKWGNPIILPALKDAYLNQIYKKADESAANERSLPARFVFPQAQSGENPFKVISMSRFSTFMKRSIQKWRQDKNAVMPVPFPVQTAEIGGDAKRFSTAKLRELSIKEIIGATGVPKGFLSDKMQWSGGSLQLHMLENMLMSYKRGLNRILRFVVQQVALVTDLPKPEDVRWKPFRMTDDLQKLEVLVNLAQQKQVSYHEILERMDLDWNDQHEKIKREQEAKEELLIKDQLVGPKAKMRAADLQAEQKFRGEGYKELKQNIHQDDQAVSHHLKGDGQYDEVDKKMEEHQKKQEKKKQKLQQEHRKAETKHKKHLSDKYKADAMRDKQYVEEEEDQQQDRFTPPLIKNKARKLVNKYDGKARKQKIETIKENSPEIGKMLEEYVEELLNRSKLPQAIQEEQQKAKQKAQKMVKGIMKNPKQLPEVAKKLQQADKEVQKATMNMLRQKSPKLFRKMTEAMQHG